MNYEINVIFSCGVEAFLPAVDVWLVVDVLRATSVITRWFEIGGAELFPVKSTDEARELTRTFKNSARNPILMGEVNGIPPEGFDLGNSPSDLNPSNVKSHDCAVMSTTNGTVALNEAASTGSPVIAASLRNYSAALDHALTFGSKIGIMCSGRKRSPSWDDTLCAGAIIKRLQELLAQKNLDDPEHTRKIFMSDSAKISLLVWESGESNLLTCIKRSEHAIYLERIGYANDLEFCCQLDAATVVPMLFTDERGRNFLKSVSGNANPYRKSQIQNSIANSNPNSNSNPNPENSNLKFEELLTYTKSTTAKPENYFFINKSKNKK